MEQKYLVSQWCEWPAQSLDMKVTENVWQTIKLRLQNEVTDIETQVDLIEAVVVI